MRIGTAPGLGRTRTARAEHADGGGTVMGCRRWGATDGGEKQVRWWGDRLAMRQTISEKGTKKYRE